jgi:hypothetical protein
MQQCDQEVKVSEHKSNISGICGTGTTKMLAEVKASAVPTGSMQKKETFPLLAELD